MRPIAIFIEGLPGSGKTTFAKKLRKTLTEQRYTVKQFNEGDLNPIDLAWCALLHPETFHAMKIKYPLLKDDFNKHSYKLKDTYVFAYTQCNHEYTTKAYYEDLEQYEIYRTKDIEYFKSMHLTLWNQFDKKAKDDTIYIFESIYIQNHINELMLKYDFSATSIHTYLNTLMNSFNHITPIVCHIEQKDVASTIGQIAQARLSIDKTKYNDWIDNVIEYIKNQPYAEKYNYTDYSGIINYFSERQIKTLDTLPNLHVKHFNYLLDSDYEVVFSLIERDIISLIKHQQ